MSQGQDEIHAFSAELCGTCMCIHRVIITCMCKELHVHVAVPLDTLRTYEFQPIHVHVEYDSDGFVNTGTVSLAFARLP